MALLSASSASSGPLRSGSSQGCSGVVGTEHPRDLSDGMALDAALPQGDDPPARTSQGLFLLSVALFVTLQLWQPVPLIALRRPGLAMRALVPEATMNENRQSFPHEGDVRPPGDLRVVQSITGQTRSAQMSSHDEFRFGVLASDPAHGGAHLRIGRLGPST